jgi:putative methyltransferase
MSPLRILISEPHAPGSVVLPYVSSVLRSWCDHHSAAPEAFEWLEPIWLRDTAEGDLDDYCQAQPDILGLSCYTWNWELQCKVARWAKRRNPHCLVVAGGPDPDYKDPDFFRTHSYIDMIVVKDGEIPFTQILETCLSGGRDFRHIPGLYLPSPSPSLRLLDQPACAHLYTGPAQVPDVFDHSPYLEQTGMYERLMAALGSEWAMATLETNRGCPYSCSFCDWGSSTMSKVRKFDIARVEAEIEWLGRIGVKVVFLADANFGILPRDVDIADRLVETRAKYHHPRALYYSSAKNNPDRTVEIARRTYDAHLTLGHVLAVQHTDSEVLAATDRTNIPTAKYREVVAKLAAFGIPSEVQLILGIPGDTVEKWKNCLAELMDWGVHDNFQASPYALLPNAPAAEPAFMAKWQIETVDRGLVPYGGIREKNSQSYTSSKIVVGWRGFGKEDWVDASTYTAFIKAYHNRALTRLPAIYLRFVHGVPYREYYDAVIDGFCRDSPLTAPLHQRVRALYREFLENPQMTDAMELQDSPGCSFLVDPSKWVFCNTCLRLDEFYRDLSRYLVSRFPNAANLAGAIRYQQQLVVTPDYSSRKGKSFPIDRDWPQFFHNARGLVDNRRLEEPAAFVLPRIAEIPREQRCGRDQMLNFGNGSAAERRSRWLVQTIKKANAAQFSNYPDPCVKRAYDRVSLVEIIRSKIAIKAI